MRAGAKVIAEYRSEFPMIGILNLPSKILLDAAFRRNLQSPLVLSEYSREDPR